MAMTVTDQRGGRGRPGGDPCRAREFEGMIDLLLKEQGATPLEQRPGRTHALKEATVKLFYTKEPRFKLNQPI